MGIVVNQTSKNILTISFALIIGGINTLYFYPEFLQAEYYGLVVFTGNIKFTTANYVPWNSTYHNKVLFLI